MRLSYKLSLGVGAALAVALGIDSYIEVQRALAEYEADLLSHTAQQAHALGISVSKLYSSYGDGGSGWRKSSAALPYAIFARVSPSRCPNDFSNTAAVSGQVESACG